MVFMTQTIKKETFKYDKGGIFCLGITEVEGLDGKTTGKHCPVFDYTGKQIVNIDGYKKKY